MNTKFHIEKSRIYSENMTLIATVAYFRDPAEEARVAALLAAAPELLAKLSALVGLAKYRGGHLDEYKAAVAEAEAIIIKAGGTV